MDVLTQNIENLIKKKFIYIYIYMKLKVMQVYLQEA